MSKVESGIDIFAEKLVLISFHSDETITQNVTQKGANSARFGEVVASADKYVGQQVSVGHK